MDQIGWGRDYVKEEDAKTRILRMLENCPKSNLQDIYVWFHQANFVSQVYNEPNLLELINKIKEVESLGMEFYFFEPIGIRSRFIRLHILSFYKYGGPLKTLEELTNFTVRNTQPNPMLFKNDWSFFKSLVRDGEIKKFELEEIDEFEDHNPTYVHAPLPHSDMFDWSYTSFYKVIQWEAFIKKFPEFTDCFDLVYFLKQDDF